MNPTPSPACGGCDSASNSGDDCGDWTLVSPPHSSSSSSSSSTTNSTPEREELESNKPEELQQQQQESLHVEDGHLTEIDLNVGSSTNAIDEELPVAVGTGLEAEVDDEIARSNSSEPTMPGFQALDTTTDDDDETGSRRSSLTRSELGEYVDLGQRSTDSIETMMQDESTDAEKINSTDTKSSKALLGMKKYTDEDYLDETNEEVEEAGDYEDDHISLSIKRKMDEMSKVIRRRREERDTHPIKPLYLVLIMVWIILILGYLVEIHEQAAEKKKLDSKTSKQGSNSNTMNSSDFHKANSIPFNQLKELQSLHDELTKCIKRQSPTSYKYYMSEERFKGESESRQKTAKKPIRGLVCYGQENRWRERFHQLKEHFKLDLRRLIQEAKNHLSSDVLESYHPTLKFKLILGQMEYLDFLENKRNKKQQEELVKFLKAENMLLLRRLSNPDESGYQKLAISLELENSRLRRENEALKVNLIGKAGPSYIKKSLELEQYERENVMLKQFHHQVAKEVGKSLRQFNLHTLTASTSLDDEESLNAQLMLTRGYLRRLSEKISTVLIENEGLKEELKEAYTASKSNLFSTNADIHDITQLHNNNVNNHSNALVSDSCIRKLIELTERLNRQDEEKEKRPRCNCSVKSNVVDLERCSERNLNLTTAKEKLPLSSCDMKQLSAVETGLDKRLTDALMSLRQDESVVNERLFKCNDQFKSNGLEGTQTGVCRGDDNKYLEEKESKLLLTADNRGAETIPIYIRETIRDSKKKRKKRRKHSNSRY